MKSILIIGMGEFGQHLAEKMTDLGNHVVIVDKDESIVSELAEKIPDAFVGDASKPGVLRSVGVNNFDICFVSVGDDFFASLEITSYLKELGAKHIVTKADGDRQSEFLKKVGADEVVYPEKDAAEKLAIQYNADNIFDNYQLSNDYSIYEVAILPEWVGKSVSDLDIRNSYKTNILAVKNKGKINPNPGAKYVFKADDHIVVIGNSREVFKLVNYKRK